MRKRKRVKRSEGTRRLKYDLFYIENMSLKTDAKILFQTIRTALAGQGQ